MANINDYTIDQLREIAINQTQIINKYKIKVEELENSNKNWREAIGRWKTKALNIKNENKNNDVKITINFKDEYNGDHLFYKIETNYGVSVDHKTIQGLFTNMTSEKVFEEFPQLKQLIKNGSKLSVFRCYKGMEVWIVEIKEVEIPKRKGYTGGVEENYIKDEETNMFVRKDIMEAQNLKVN